MSQRIKKPIVGIACGLALLVCGLNVVSTSASMHETNQRETLRHGGQTQTFWIHVPQNHALDKELPVVLVFHGGGGTGQGMIRLTGMNAISDKEGFMAVYPDGVNQGWNDGRTEARSTIVDDVEFVSDLIECLVKNYKLDRRRI